MSEYPQVDILVEPEPVTVDISNADALSAASRLNMAPPPPGRFLHDAGDDRVFEAFGDGGGI